MKLEKVKYFTKSQLMEANRQAIKAGCNAITPEFIASLPDGLKYPIFFRLPWERHGWVRCQVGAATSMPPRDFTPLWFDVPQGIYENLDTVDVPVDEEVAQ
jgi:hypothetical protein